MRVAIIQHGRNDGPTLLNHWLYLRELTSHVYRAYEGDLPHLDSFDLLVLLGGPMSVHDEREYAWLSAEKRLVEASLVANKHVLGISLGGQILAQVLGAQVYDAECPEIGWWPIEQRPEACLSPLGRLLPQRMMAMHWHAEDFSLPLGAVPLYRTQMCPLEGFVWDERAVALLCHLECSPEGIERLLKAYPEDLNHEGAVQDAQTIRAGSMNCMSYKATLFRVLDYLGGARLQSY